MANLTDLTDITLNSEPYRLVPGGYDRRPAAASPASPQRQQLSRFELGLGIAQDDELPGDQGGGWSGLTVRSVGGGAGLEPFPTMASWNDTMDQIPNTNPVTARAHGVIAGNNAFLGLGKRIYRSVALDSGVGAGSWSDWAEFADLGDGFTCSGLVYYQDGVLIMLNTGQDIRKVNTTSGALTIWRSGQSGQIGVGYAGQAVYAPRLPNQQEELRLSGVRWNGNAVTHTRFLDSPIINMALFDSQVVIATKTSLYRMGGQNYPGEADDPNVTADTSTAPRWTADPEPLLTHGVFASGDDFIFLAAYRGRLYTWLAGQVAQYDGGPVWNRTGPQGAACWGGCVSGDWLVVALTTAAGNHELWGFDGTGWWRFISRTSPEVVWPVALGGAGFWDVAAFRAGVDTYDLLRLVWHSHQANTYAPSGEWVSPLLTGGDAGTDTAWRRVDAWFAWPEIPGNPASLDTVAIALDYSIDAGASWTEIDTANVTVGREHHLFHEFPTVPVSRTLQLRVRWSGVVDWAPILTHLDVDLAHLDTSPRRQRWELQLAVRDQLAASDRPEIDALWGAWRLASVPFRDIDYDTTPVERTVRVMDIQERAPQAAGADQAFAGGIVTVTLSEL